MDQSCLVQQKQHVQAHDWSCSSLCIVERAFKLACMLWLFTVTSRLLFLGSRCYDWKPYCKLAYNLFNSSSIMLSREEHGHASLGAHDLCQHRKAFLLKVLWMLKHNINHSADFTWRMKNRDVWFVQGDKIGDFFPAIPDLSYHFLKVIVISLKTFTATIVINLKITKLNF